MRRLRLILALALLASFSALAGPDLRALWSPGTPAANTAEALKPIAPAVVQLPAALAAKVQGETALFYFSPTCPHCRHIMPEVLGLQGKDGLRWIGVASGNSKPEELAEFRSTFAPPFPIVLDEGSGFARAVGARSTPTLYLARPVPGAVPVDGAVDVELFEGYAPMSPGSGAVLLMRRDPNNAFAHFQGYQGDAVCGMCHLTESMSMALTHHDMAYRTLYLRDRATDEACVKCHVTGLGQPGGFVMGDHGHPQAGVRCEACHGPSGPHDGQRDEASAACVGCHDAEHSIAFSVEKGLPHIDHYKAATMSEAELVARLTALRDGEAPRPLLAFPNAETVGSAACQSCHKTQHKWAKKDPHAGAMGLLKEADAQRVECVSCHATPARYGPAPGALVAAAPSSLAEFRTDEGAGCEVCHGPGGAHVQEPRKDNIVGLGDSCPECVIEAVCTSCHTDKWDPKWSLKPRLAAIDH